MKCDLAKARTDIEALKGQVERLQTTVREHQSVHVTLQDEVKRSKGALEAAQKSATRAREETKRADIYLQKLQAENDVLKQK